MLAYGSSHYLMGRCGIFFSVNGFIEWSANISGSIWGLFFIYFFFFTASLLLCSVKISVWQRSFVLIGSSLWRRGDIAPGVTCQNHPESVETGGLRIRLCFFYSSTQMELNNKN